MANVCPLELIDVTPTLRLSLPGVSQVCVHHFLHLNCAPFDIRRDVLLDDGSSLIELFSFP